LDYRFNDLSPGLSHYLIAELERLDYIANTSYQHEQMQNIRWECAVDNTGYKEYEVFLNEQPLGIISWSSGSNNSKGCWYTIVSDSNDGHPCYFQTQEEVIDFLRANSSEPIANLSAKLKTEAWKLTLMAEQLEFKSIDVKAQDDELRDQVEELKAGVEELEVKLKNARTEHNCD